MDTQLRLIEAEHSRSARGGPGRPRTGRPLPAPAQPTWPISEETRRIGYDGVARARAELRRARGEADLEDPGTSDAPAA